MDLGSNSAVGTSTTKKLTSRFLAFNLSPKRIGRRIIPVGFTSYPPKPKMGCIKGMMSHPGYVSFFKQSQVIMLTELPVSIRIHRTIALAIFISTTKGSLCGEAKRGASFPPNTIVGTVMQVPCSVWPRLPLNTLHLAAGVVRTPALVEGNVNLSSEIDRSDPCLPIYEELSSGSGTQ
ncbi:hypothetical protein Cgig2_014985 [Carnegiea gigantea]|uniref:Uncharacterized protein n=1 Tax=Carnegiea gigantea TaxID=171969 RepID=A0A9Q1JWU1_9CARY|nr:hypothetical protein Cgig2_014985 [Carnegiea gigantea]